ncbi:MAG: response regulator [Anaerolineales bacterium]|nr:response regulator [Anaerolineales bacterium]
MNNKPTILLVEDDPALRDLIVLVLERKLTSKMQLVTASNGQDALISLKKDHPDIMILDILLPLMNGLQVIQQMKNERIFDRTKIVVITALGFKEVVQKALNEGVSDFLVKPLDLNVLCTRVQRYIDELKKPSYTEIEK